MAKSILEQALLEATQLEEAVKSNAKEILARTMKQEIEELVKESVEEEEIESDEELDTEGVEDVEVDIEDVDLEDIIPMDDEEGIEVEDELMLQMMSDDEEPLDLTMATDDEVLKVFKAMGPEDGIVVSMDDETIDLEDAEAGTEYRIEINEEKEPYKLRKEMEKDETIFEIEMSDDLTETMFKPGEDPLDKGVEEGRFPTLEEDDDTGRKLAKNIAKAVGLEGLLEGDDEETVYELEVEEGMDNEFDMDEASRTYGFGSKDGSRGLRKGFTNNRNLSFYGDDTPEVEVEADDVEMTDEVELQVESKEVRKLKALNETYKAKNDEFRKALKTFKNKLNEVAVFNSNLAYSTKLFTEHTTTKKEKINILKRFDDVQSLNESKSLYGQITKELQSKGETLTESFKKSITKTPSNGSSVNLIETKTYENPQISRMKDLMSKL